MRTTRSPAVTTHRHLCAVSASTASAATSAVPFRWIAGAPQNPKPARSSHFRSSTTSWMGSLQALHAQM
ncbi:hypothetical protein PUNSTDRAFT_55985, partial [Punctularia strigosozonata HHB-11173 SS5]